MHTQNTHYSKSNCYKVSKSLQRVKMKSLAAYVSESESENDHNSPVSTKTACNIQRWVIAIKKTNQLPTTLPIILYLVIGITN